MVLLQNAQDKRPQDKITQYRTSQLQNVPATKHPKSKTSQALKRPNSKNVPGVEMPQL
jgi:hypothetical protein